MADLRELTSQLDGLTDKQREVLVYVSDGLTSKEIAKKLGITESAVNQRIETIRGKLNGLTRAEIARLHRSQSTLVITIPTSNSLTGKPLQLHDLVESVHHTQVEGAVELPERKAGEQSGRLQPSTFSPLTDHPDRIWFRLAAIALLALALVSSAVLALSAAQTIDRIWQ